MTTTIVNMPFSDDKAVKRLHQMHVAMSENISLFEAEDPTIFNEAFIIRCQLAINGLHTMRRDSTIRSMGRSSTLIKDEYINQAKDLWARLKIRLNLAQQQTTDNLLAVFGANTYAKSILNPIKMVGFWSNVQREFASGTYANAFQNVYIPPSLWVDIEQNRSDLDAIWRAMKDFPLFRLKETIERNERRAELMSCLRTISSFGKVIFRNKPEYKLFVMRSGTYKPMPTHILSANTVQVIPATSLDLSSVVSIKNVGQTEVMVYAAEEVDAPVPEVVVVVKAGEDAILSVSHITMVDVPRVLVLRNDSGRKARIKLTVRE